MTSFSAAGHLQGLKPFQRATVDHVSRRFYEDDPPARRFLVADETGLGKSLVAKGVIARSIEHLQHDDGCKRIDIVYVCSNADIAQQNLKHLDLLGTGSSQHATRLTLLARHANDLEGAPHPEVGKRVNLVSFTPGTSFELGYSTGRADERALLHVILCNHLGYETRTLERAAMVVLQGDSYLHNFERNVSSMHWNLGDAGADPAITKPFLRMARSSGLLRRFKKTVEGFGRRTSMSGDEREEHKRLVGDLRSALARAGVDALEPDVIILDEFQRFRHLLATDDPRHQESAELAHLLFAYGNAKVLLLSATPYKSFTYAEETATGDDHAADLRRTLGFLANGNGQISTVDGIVEDLGAYRKAAIDGSEAAPIRERLESSLTSLMCRTERPRLGDDGMLREQCTDAAPVEVCDVMAFASLQRVAKNVGAPLAVDYWKSTPYFINFGDGYQVGQKLRSALDERERRDELRPLLQACQHLDADKVRRLEPLDPGNARMRQLSAETVDAGWWQLLWMQPSAPYDSPGGPFAEPFAARFSKRLIFSSWTATPTAIAAILSHEANRRLAGSREELETVSTRLDWRNDGGRPASMTTLMLFWPSPAAARRASPFNGRPEVDARNRATGGESWLWTKIFADPESAPNEVDVGIAAAALSGEVDDLRSIEHGRLEDHASLALDLRSGSSAVEAEQRGTRPDDLDQTLASISRFAPGNVAYRCFSRLRATDDRVTDLGHWQAAAVVGGAFRSLFNRTDSTLLLSKLLPDAVYWRAVLQYCAWGNLEAVLDEFLHHLSETDRARGLDDASLIAIAQRARKAITPRPSRYEAFDPLHRAPIAFPSRFALRYGSKRANNDESARLPDIREAFNSPFWPFVLATTSVGQEGIDFHWWCHAAVHWNTPASPVDFEQREGRVHRYGGLAIRRNLADQHRDEMLEAGATGGNPWDAAYAAGIAAATDRFDGLVPHWLVAGPTKIERHLFPYPLSRDADRYQRLKDDLAVYRLTFGQPRQEDLADLLKQRGVQTDPAEISRLRLDLRPPAPADAGRQPATHQSDVPPV